MSKELEGIISKTKPFKVTIWRDNNYDDYEERFGDEQSRIRHLLIDELIVPHAFIGPISGKIMEQPVMIESGVTYEKSYIESFFK